MRISRNGRENTSYSLHTCITDSLQNKHINDLFKNKSCLITFENKTSFQYYTSSTKQRKSTAAFKQMQPVGMCDCARTVCSRESRMFGNYFIHLIIALEHLFCLSVTLPSLIYTSKSSILGVYVMFIQRWSTCTNMATQETDRKVV